MAKSRTKLDTANDIHKAHFAQTEFSAVDDYIENISCLSDYISDKYERDQEHNFWSLA